ncbi:hypothetical protein ANN_21698 [Periplaneta americana]|uniref:Uncharacterized protein n=1 Tax=Periplaneta americana TaxID=6978 RepID=A0ABQ8S6M4_PERAM|nr:hypothetical protein ANN_21698 [Periplaneta americana]
MNQGSSTESYPAFARIGLRENPGINLNQVTCPDRNSNPGQLVSRPDALAVTPQVWTVSMSSSVHLLGRDSTSIGSYLSPLGVPTYTRQNRQQRHHWFSDFVNILFLFTDVTTPTTSATTTTTTTTPITHIITPTTTDTTSSINSTITIIIIIIIGATTAIHDIVITIIIIIKTTVTIIPHTTSITVTEAFATTDIVAVIDTITVTTDTITAITGTITNKTGDITTITETIITTNIITVTGTGNIATDVCIIRTGTIATITDTVITVTGNITITTDITTIYECISITTDTIITITNTIINTIYIIIITITDIDINTTITGTINIATDNFTGESSITLCTLHGSKKKILKSLKITSELSRSERKWMEVKNRTKYFPKNLILKNPQPLFLSQSESPSFTAVQNNRIPTRNTILRWVASFRITGSTLKKKSPGRNSIALRLSEATQVYVILTYPPLRFGER